MLAALLALAASVSWGTSDFLAGLQSRRYSAWAVAAVSQPAAMLVALLVVVVRLVGPPSLASLAAPLLAGAVAAAASLAEYQALRISSMTLVAPIVAGSAVVPFVAGLARGDRPSALQITGAALAVAGIVAISRGRAGVAAGAAPAAQGLSGPSPGSRGALPLNDAGRGRDRVRAQAVLLALACALGFGLLLVAFDLGGKADPYWTVASARCTSAAALSVYLMARRPRIRLPARALPAVVAVGLLLALANTFFTLASARGNLSVVGILGSLYPAVTVGLAAALLRERLGRRQLIAAGMILAGIVCLAYV
jgi:drug/metabolite transporter (DMT)-like permease